ncbi:hypothetical protein EX30DRAFT_396461 [Ascodesmis nigricans]|uniref:Uncharacterized protein n=1 Tax=Ascodesmis nigricans TaxID=341454 RepID=A0A4S2MUC8_9PEZI|nr:hypothetical protein EX30DRAFT_396461 [Ascodesmis nigricans]
MSTLHPPPASRPPPPSSPRSSTSSSSIHSHDSPAFAAAAQMAPIEARSLAPISKLAANPPSSLPDFELAAQRSSLLLWIVRVPDSKDMILTPLHPPKTTATASDIAASLYYLHFTSPTSATLIRRDAPNNIQENVASLDNLLSASVTISLPTAGYQRLSIPEHERPPPPPRHLQSPSNIPGMPIRKPVPGQQPPHPPTLSEPPFTRTLTLESVIDSSSSGSSKRHSIPGFSKLQHIRRKSGSSPQFQSSLPSPSPSPSFPPSQRLSPYSTISSTSTSTTYSYFATPTPGSTTPSLSPLPSPLPSPTPQKRKKNGYLFVSPWSSTSNTPDTCEFQSEALGRFLKLKYYTPGVKPSRALLSVVELAKHPKPGSHHQHREGLLGHHHHKKSKHNDGGGGGGGEGGGNGYEKNGVLGMMIVHGVGFEMLDLLVAANFVALARKWDKWERERKAVGY